MRAVGIHRAGAHEVLKSRRSKRTICSRKGRSSRAWVTIRA